MKKSYISVLFFSVLILCILSNTNLAIYYACLGLNLWYSKMIPALFPLMIISGIIIRMNLNDSFVAIIYPFFQKVFHLSKAACYVFFFGFLCGFPMGAKTINDLYERNALGQKEAELLLYFCNNIGPAYFLGFVLPLLHRKLVLPYLFGMYGIPIFYGLFLRYSFYKEITIDISSIKKIKNIPLEQNVTDIPKRQETLLDAVENSIHSSVESILMLGGYMILCNVLNTLLFFIPNDKGIVFMPLLEISGGLSALKYRIPLYSLLAITFGGLSCILQTFSCLKAFNISVKRKYVFHKCILTGITLLYYILWFRFFPESFLK